MPKELYGNGMIDAMQWRWKTEWMDRRYSIQCGMVIIMYVKNVM